jgi:hypothetical protein
MEELDSLLSCGHFRKSDNRPASMVCLLGFSLTRKSFLAGYFLSTHEKLNPAQPQDVSTGTMTIPPPLDPPPPTSNLVQGKFPIHILNIEGLNQVLNDAIIWKFRKVISPKHDHPVPSLCRQK